MKMFLLMYGGSDGTRVPTLLEWDDKIPSFDEVHAEALKAGGFAQNVEDTFPGFSVWMARDGAWLFILPMLWVAAALFCEQAIRGTIAEKLARASGVLVAIAIFAAYFYASALLF